MNANERASEFLALLATTSPQSLGTGATNGAWVSMDKFHQVMLVLKSGVLGTAATVDCKLQQATSSGGAGVKDISGAAITQIVKASGDDKQAIINLRASQLDVEGGFKYVRYVITVGAAASLLDAALWGVNARYKPASDYNAASVVQVV